MKKNPATHETAGDKNPRPEIIVSRRANGTKRVVTINAHDSRAQQQFKKDCDVNLIIAKFKKTGTVTHVRNAAAGVYADMTDAPSYQEALQTVINAERAFEEVPAKIRERFNHDPALMMEFLSQKENDEEAIKLGLKIKPQPPAPDPMLTTLNTIAENTKPKPKPKPSND